MPVVGFIAAVLGSALYGLLLGVGWYAAYLSRGAPGATGMEILGIPFFTVQATIEGTIAAAVSLVVPRTSLRWSDSFVLLAAASFVMQALVSLPPNMIADGLQRYDLFTVLFAMSGPVDWRTNGLNTNWLYTVPLTLALCSPRFRSWFD